MKFFFKMYKMNVLVTGANGLLGHQVVMELLRRFEKVTIIVRSLKNIHFDVSLVTVFEGNFADKNTFALAAKNCDAIIHIAAVTSTNLMHYHDYHHINVEGTKQILKVADELGIKNMVFVSTTNTIGYGTKENPADENSNIQFPFSASFYAQSKVEYEQLIMEASTNPNKHIIIVNPAFMIGAYDTKPSSGKLLIMGYKRRIMFVPSGGKNFVAASDVAVAVCNAINMGKNGERYIASGMNLSFKEYYTLQKSVGEYEQYLLELPNFLLKIAGQIGDLVRKFGVKTELCSMNLNQLMINEYYKNDKATNELVLPQTELKIAILEAIKWFKDTKMIK